MQDDARTDARTEQPADPDIAPMGEASPPPTLLLWILAIPVFAVITWGMMLLFGQKPYEFTPDGPQVPLPPDPEAEPPQNPQDP